MRTSSERLVDLFSLLGIAACSLALMALLLPPLEEGREHARKTQAWNITRRLMRETDEASRKSLLAEPDPWGQPYRLVVRSDGGTRAVSSGPNMSSPDDGLDEDDIYTDMPASPNAAADRAHDLRMLMTLGFGAGVWLLTSLWYVRFRSRNNDDV